MALKRWAETYNPEAATQKAHQVANDLSEKARRASGRAERTNSSKDHAKANEAHREAATHWDKMASATPGHAAGGYEKLAKDHRDAAAKHEAKRSYQQSKEAHGNSGPDERNRDDQGRFA